MLDALEEPFFNYFHLDCLHFQEHSSRIFPLYYNFFNGIYFIVWFLLICIWLNEYLILNTGYCNHKYKYLNSFYFQEHFSRIFFFIILIFLVLIVTLICIWLNEYLLLNMGYCNNKCVNSFHFQKHFSRIFLCITFIFVVLIVNLICIWLNEYLLLNRGVL
jgi:hypothetical protein